jgi:hypothetical protein
VHTDTLARKLTNCIAADNGGAGFTTNDNDCEGKSMHIYNNISYNNGRSQDAYTGVGFMVYNTVNSDEQELLRVFKNNIAYNNEVDVSASGSALYTHEYNSWDLSISISDSDFISLDTSQLSAPRKPGGGLPDITFGRLDPG